MLGSYIDSIYCVEQSAMKIVQETNLLDVHAITKNHHHWIVIPL